MLQLITPPRLALTSTVDANSLTGRVVWNTRFELAAIAIGFLLGVLLAHARPTRRPDASADAAPPASK
jgi:hypothetical protein